MGSIGILETFQFSGILLQEINNRLENLCYFSFERYWIAGLPAKKVSVSRKFLEMGFIENFEESITKVFISAFARNFWF